MIDGWIAETFEDLMEMHGPESRNPRIRIANLSLEKVDGRYHITGGNLDGGWWDTEEEAVKKFAKTFWHVWTFCMHAEDLKR